MLGVNSSGFAVRKVSPAISVAKPPPTMSRVKRGTVPTQQFHLATA
jgi:hypothetical protein